MLPVIPDGLPARYETEFFDRFPNLVDKDCHVEWWIMGRLHELWLDLNAVCDQDQDGDSELKDGWLSADLEGGREG